MNPIIKNLYTREEIQDRIKNYMERCEKSKSKNDYSSMISEYNNIAIFFEILGNKEKSNYYYQKIIDEWYAHLKGVPHHSCINALEMLQMHEEALKIVLSNPRMWDIEILTRLYEEMGRKAEAIVIYSSLATYSFRFSEAYYPFWQPHYLQEASDIWTRMDSPDHALKYNQKAVAAWEHLKDNIQRSLSLIEEAWLYEEVGYIYEKTGKFETAMDYYQKAQSKYEKAHTEEPHVVGAHQIDGDWNRYFKFFIRQIPDFGLIHFRYEHPEDNDYRRMKYRILNLKDQMNEV